MIPPTVEDIRGWSKLDFVELDYPEPAGSDPDPLDTLLDRGISYVQTVSGRLLDATMPLGLVETAREAVQMRVEQLVFQSQDDYVETGADDQISNFSVTGYSETRGGPPHFRAGVQDRLPPINPWNALNERLWLLVTDDQRDFWLERLQVANIPAFQVSEVDWEDTGLGPEYFWPGA